VQACILNQENDESFFISGVWEEKKEKNEERKIIINIIFYIG